MGLHVWVAGVRVSTPLSYQRIAEGAILPDDWHWGNAGHAPLLGTLGRTVSQLFFASYLHNWDSSRAERRGTPQKRQYLHPFCSENGPKGISTRGTKARPTMAR